ncbi:MAG TPA: L-threonylcarbamoyladenylate synthase [Candidatus Limnocylindrales bacterium]
MSARIVPDGAAGRASALDALRAGGIVAFPTDTVYGIGIAPATPDGLERLFAAKERPPDKAIVMLLGDAGAVTGLATWTPAGEVLARAFWPGGLTIVLPRAADARVRLALSHGDELPPTVGVRVPDHPAPRFLAAGLGALPTTSANRSGQPEAATADAIRAQLGASLALIVDAGPAPGGPPSTVADASGDTVTIVRRGAVSDDAIARVLRAAGLPEPVGR